MANGFIHSFESMGLVDGPGIRSVVFLEGCKLRCQFCHNPDTWAKCGKIQMSPEELVKKLLRFKTYFDKSGGGVTFSGGEPLLQPEFLIEALKLCKQHGIHTCIDTAGVGLGNYDNILEYTDLVLYDVKHYTSDGYLMLTGCEINETLAFVDALKKNNTPIWVRHVVIPEITDSKSHIQGLRDYIKTLPNVKKVELLPYHLLGANKYKSMGIPYPLEGVPAMDKDVCKALQTEFFSEFGGNVK